MTAKIQKTHVRSFFKGLAFALVFALGAVLVFALILKIAGGASELIIRIANSLIRIGAAAVACFFYCREEKGVLRGSFMGFVCFFAIYLLFGILGGGWKWQSGRLLDFVLTVAAGAIFGALFVNLKKR